MRKEEKIIKPRKQPTPKSNSNKEKLLKWE
jgi:hypothetical protein